MKISHLNDFKNFKILYVFFTRDNFMQLIKYLKLQFKNCNS